MTTFLQGLNPEQKKAVVHQGTPLLILAGAGTGKTKVVTSRIAHLLASGTRPGSIVGLTFTNKAAREMRERLAHLFPTGKENPWLGTFHSYTLTLLRRFRQKAKLSSSFSIASTSDQLDIIRKTISSPEFGFAQMALGDPERLLALISRAKNLLLDPSQLEELSALALHHIPVEVFQRLYEIYTRQMQICRLIDFDDCIFLSYRLLKNHDDVLETVHRELRHLMVDEFQDTNFAQLEFLKLLKGPDCSLCCVGDDDQAIYSWRGALPQTMVNFDEIYPDVTVIKLEQNYRCTPVILSAANAVIKNNTKRSSKVLWSASQEETPITLEPASNEAAEAEQVVQKCLSLLGEGLPARDIAILSRTTIQFKALEMALSQTQIPYRVVGGTAFLERREVRDFIAYLRLISDPDDRLAFWRVINSPNRGFGLKTLEKIEALTQQQHISPFAVCAQGLIKLPKDTAEAFGRFRSHLLDFHAKPLTSLATFAREVIRAFSLNEEILKYSADASAAKKRLDLLYALPTWLENIGNYLQKDGPLPTLREILDHLTLDGSSLSREKKTPDQCVTLMTIHAAKGLEFNSVFLCGVEEEILPHKTSIAEGAHATEEERRLFYVALTRAKRRLFISYCLERGTPKEGVVLRQPSRFLKEVPATVLAAAADTQQPPQTAAQATLNTLSQLRLSLQDSRKRATLNP